QTLSTIHEFFWGQSETWQSVVNLARVRFRFNAATNSFVSFTLCLLFKSLRPRLLSMLGGRSNDTTSNKLSLFLASITNDVNREFLASSLTKYFQLAFVD